MINIIFYCLITLSYCSIISPLYHSNEEIYSALDVLVKGKCHNILHSNSVIEDGHILRYYTLTSTVSTQIKNKAVLIFGEHPRELISSEFALYLIQTLCKEHQVYSNATINSILERNELILVPIVNEFGHKRVEAGKICSRHNENNVDLSRNWETHWVADNPKASPDEKQYSGSKPFSEWETRAINNLIKQIKPNIFISTHSGIYSLLTPFGYKENDKDPQIRRLLTIVKSLNDKYCHCSWGSIYSSIPYPTSGISVDYVYEELKIRYAFVFEIYDGLEVNEYFKKLFASNEPQYVFDINKSSIINLIQLNSKMRVEPIVTRKKSNGFLDNGGKAFKEIDWKLCFVRCNPQTKKKYNKIMINWVNVYFELFTMIYHLEHK